MNVSFVGSGNVATHLARAFYKAGFNIEQVCSPTEYNAKTLASQVDAGFLTNLGDLKSVDLLVISVKDDVILETISQLEGFKGLVVHTSGATPLSAFEGKIDAYGVFYPLQTFSKQVEVDFTKIPLCIEGKDVEIARKLMDIGSKLSTSVREVRSDDRKILHLAAVFTCNFVNHLYVLGKEILDAAHLPFELLLPLIEQTTEKIKLADPKDVQTGPAVRGDEKVMSAHLELLKNNDQLKKTYIFLSESIKKTHS